MKKRGLDINSFPIGTRPFKKTYRQWWKEKRIVRAKNKGGRRISTNRQTTISRYGAIAGKAEGTCFFQEMADKDQKARWHGGGPYSGERPKNNRAKKKEEKKKSSLSKANEERW